MMIYLSLFVFTVFYAISAYIDSGSKINAEKTLGILACLVLTFLAGNRDPASWADTEVYLYSFSEVPSAPSFSFSEKPIGYTEKGFSFLGSLLKVFTSDGTVYLFFIAALSIFILFADIRKYSIFPLVGLCCYIARFYMNRNMIQIRAGLSYAILLYAIQYITVKDWKRYFLVVALATTLHHSALVAVPLYFFCNMVKPKRWHVIVVLVLSFVIGAAGQGIVHRFVEDNSSDMSIDAYTQKGGYATYYQGAGLSNPMIYFEVVLLLVYTFAEKKLKEVDENYYAIRMAYLYSTAFLICFCSYKVLASRTASIYATLEYCVIPSLIYIVPRKNRPLAFAIAGVLLLLVFKMYLNQQFQLMGNS